MRVAGAVALVLAAVQLLGAAVDARSSLWGATFVVWRYLIRDFDVVVLVFLETALGVGWLIAGAVLLRGNTATPRWLAVLLVVSLAISASVIAVKLSFADFDRSGVVCLGLEVLIGALLALKSARAGTGRRSG